MPVTSRGKLDRKRLPPPPADLGMGEGDFVPCESRTEKVIEAVWQELLGYDDTPISALGEHASLYDGQFTHFNPIQTQACNRGVGVGFGGRVTVGLGLGRG